jgi:hypothetical protein
MDTDETQMQTVLSVFHLCPSVSICGWKITPETGFKILKPLVRVGLVWLQVASSKLQVAKTARPENFQPVTFNLQPTMANLTDTQRREYGLICGRLFSPPWLIARATRNERVKRETETVPITRIRTPGAERFGVTVLPATFHL